MKPIYFYYNIIQNHYQKGLDEKLLNTVSLAKDVLNNIENECSTLVKYVLVSLCAKIIQLNCTITALPELRRLSVVLANCSILVFLLSICITIVVLVNIAIHGT